MWPFRSIQWLSIQYFNTSAVWAIHDTHGGFLTQGNIDLEHAQLSDFVYQKNTRLHVVLFVEDHGCQYQLLDLPGHWSQQDWVSQYYQTLQLVQEQLNIDLSQCYWDIDVAAKTLCYIHDPNLSAFIHKLESQSARVEAIVPQSQVQKPACWFGPWPLQYPSEVNQCLAPAA